MDFRLIYKGPLPAQGAGTGGSRVSAKHDIRKQLHGQLRELWKKHLVLQRYMVETVDAETGKRNSYAISSASQFTKGAYRFLPLITKARGIACSLDFLFLRRDGPGNLIEGGGDLDNRMKTFIDGLTVPNDSQISGKPSEGEDPFFVLLEDDALIAEIKITTDRLLMPQAAEEQIHDVHLVVHVKSKVVDDRIAFSIWR